MARGSVRWFSGEKGFGFVEAENGERLLVHFTEIEGDGFKTLDRGARVEFEVSEDGRGRRFASCVRTLGKDEFAG
ncbi:MAG: cold-shock protein [Rubrobacteraceae bacterium]